MAPSNYNWAAPKPKPNINVPDGQELVRCNKCGGNGLYVQAVVNGQPWSATGTQCWSCGGTGWKTRKQRRKRCPRCNILVYFEGDEPGIHTIFKQVGGVFKHVVCE